MVPYVYLIVKIIQVTLLLCENKATRYVSNGNLSKRRICACKQLCTGNLNDAQDSFLHIFWDVAANMEELSVIKPPLRRSYFWQSFKKIDQD